MLVDEYQDVNSASTSLLDQLAENGRNVWVVADPRQSIYRFRGAAPANAGGFTDRYAGAERLQLKTNYRSCETVVRVFGLPEGLKVDGMPPVADPRHPVEVMCIPRLRLHPSAVGIQHCEIAGMRDAIEQRTAASWLPEWVRRWARGKSWETIDRAVRPDATVHPSVDERFAADSVVQRDGTAPYRPVPLAGHERFRQFYGG